MQFRFAQKIIIRRDNGIIKKENLTATGDVDPADIFKVGDEVEAEVVTLNDGEGNVVLSRRSIESKLRWKELVENLEEDKVYVVKIDKVVNDYIKVLNTEVKIENKIDN